MSIESTGLGGVQRWLSRRRQAEKMGVSLRTIERWGEADSKVKLPPEVEINARFYRENSAFDAAISARKRSGQT